MLCHRVNDLQYPQALLGESAQVKNVGCMMALPECDIQVIFNQTRQSIWHEKPNSLPLTGLAFGWTTSKWVRTPTPVCNQRLCTSRRHQPSQRPDRVIDRPSVCFVIMLLCLTYQQHWCPYAGTGLFLPVIFNSILIIGSTRSYFGWMYI